MTGRDALRVLRAMQVGLDEELKDVSRKLDAVAELLGEVVPALPLPPDRRRRVRAAMDKLVEAQTVSVENARRRADRYRAILDEATAPEEVE